MVYVRSIIFLSFLLSSLWQGCCAATGNENLFAQATALYKQQQYQDALDTYSKIIDKDRGVYFNQGNCAFKLEKYGLALLFWRRAERDWGVFNRHELSDNISLVKKVTSPRSKESLEQGPWVMFLSSVRSLRGSCVSFIRATPLLVFQVIFLLLWLLFFLVFKWLKRKKYKFLIIVIAVLYTCTGILLVSKYSMTYKVYGVVTARQATLYSGPGETYQTLGTLREASEVTILRESDGYCKIRTPINFGWVDRKTIDII
jgi:tetratricopeptide (TPR) repeat protein